MIELREMADGHLSRGYGGDTFNTAVYLARLGVPVDYVTALGDDSWSDEMIAGWPAEGVGTGLVMRVPGRVPGLYVIQTDEKGERRFSYWRDSAPARDLFALPQTAELVAALMDYDVLYLSGITLSLYDDSGRKHAPSGEAAQGIVFAKDSKTILVQFDVERALAVYQIRNDTLVDTGKRLRLDAGPVSIRTMPR
jgi:sugar/nucleoside kinase (ribokinase family)